MKGAIDKAKELADEIPIHLFLSSLKILLILKYIEGLLLRRYGTIWPVI